VRKAEKARRIQVILDELYPDPPIPLAHGDPFTLLVAVLLSAQTTDARVNLVTPALFARASTPEAMAELEVSEILEIIRTCGLAPGKAKNIRRLSEILVAEHGGSVPETLEELEALPGVGHKTASVVIAQAFGQPAFPVDTHIHRLAARWGLSNGRSVEQTERDLKRLFPRDCWDRLHLQMIYFGREHCRALRHDFAACPICSWAASMRRIAAESRRSSGAR
jgi:endonuclease III